ncbi:hypothetical protein [Amycolatopsis sp. NPDC021455]|uniref:hypothetical protein n=1 Tax=Amycolatopsis sp. NPDC021455 TaxID=3154901 RepID=UPI0033EEC491
MGTANVTVVDLRDNPAVRPDELAGGVVVLDAAASLVDHADRYLELVGDDMVTAVVCIAVGEAGTDRDPDGVVLTLPPAMRYATVLWVGDPRGVEWGPGSAHLRPVEEPGTALDRLVAVLRVPQLFDRVVAAVAELGAGVVNPGIRLVSGAAAQAELAATAAAAIRSLCEPDHPPSLDLGLLVRQLDGTQDPDGALLHGPVSAAGTAASRSLDEVDRRARALGDPLAVLWSGGPDVPFGDLAARAGESAERYRRFLVELLNRMDGQLQVGRPPIEKVVELGVRAPDAARNGDVAENLRKVVDARLEEGVPLPALAHEVSFAAASSGPQGCAKELDEVRRRGPATLEPPPFPRWPLGPAVLPVIVLGCAALTLLCGPGWPGWAAGGALSAVWFTIALLLPRHSPGRAGPGVAVVHGAVALAGVAAAGFLPRPDLPPLAVDSLVVLSLLLSAAAVVFGRRSAVRGWRKTLPTTHLRDELTGLTRLTEEAVRREWQPMRRRRATASVATEVAGGLAEIATVLSRPGTRLFGAADGRAEGLSPHQPHTAARDLYPVVRGDLVDLCRTALAPAWLAAESAVRVPTGEYAKRFELLLAEYDSQVGRQGLISGARLSSDPAQRSRLIARAWAEAPGTLTALMTRAGEDMVQLCRRGQLGYLRTGGEPGLIRFAPAHLRRVLAGDGVHQRIAADPEIEWSDSGELVGALRLLPLRPESVSRPSGGA